jgi:hypothetical protein
MTNRELQNAFELEVARHDSALLIESNIIVYWLNQAIESFVKTRYSGFNIKNEGFEQTQKRTDDLRTLVVQESLTPTAGSNNIYNVDLSLLTEDYWFALAESVKIAFISLIDSQTELSGDDLVSGRVYKVTSGSVVHSAVTYNTGSFFVATGTSFTGNGTVIQASSSIESVKEATINNYLSLLQNPFSEHILHFEKASPLRLFLGNTVQLITDGNYQPVVYYITYLKKPAVISVNYGAFDQADCDLPEHTHSEIVKLAVKMALENIEQPRYRSYANEIATIE